MYKNVQLVMQVVKKSKRRDLSDTLQLFNIYVPPQKRKQNFNKISIKNLSDETASKKRF